jgi:hypothetical protein
MDPFEISKGSTARGLFLASNPTQKWKRVTGGATSLKPITSKLEGVPQQAKPFGPRATAARKRTR